MATSSSTVGTPTSLAATVEVKHLADRLNAAQVKVKRLARLEAAIVDVFMEVMDRTATLPTAGANSLHLRAASDDDSSAFAKAKRRDEYVKKAEGDPIALLNALRTHLRVQFTAHEQQHHEMQQTIQKLTVRSERNARDASTELRQWEAACANAQQQMRALAQQLTTTESDHDRTTRQYKRTLEQLHSELHQVRAASDNQREQLTKRQADVDELKRANEMLSRDRKRVTDELARTGDHLRPSSSGGSTVATATGGAVATGLVGSTPAEQQNLKRVLQDYECKLSKLETTNDELRLELQRQQHHLASVKQSTQAQHCAKLEKDAKKLRDALEDKTKTLAEHDAELLRTRGHLKERETLIRDMKDEYNKLFTAMQKIKQNPSQARPQLARSSSTSHIGLHKRSPSRAALTTNSSGGKKPGSSEAAVANAELLRAQANDNPYLLDHYKAKIEQQAKEMERLQTQLRKMIASEYRHKQKNSLFRVERVQLKDTCDTLRSELERAVKTTAKAMAQQMPFIVDGSDDDDDAGVRGNTVQSSRTIGKHDRQPEDEHGDGDDTDRGRNGDGTRERTSNQLSCTIADVRRLRQRNLYLEERFRAASDAGDSTAVRASGSPHKDTTTTRTRPPRPSSSSAVPSLTRQSTVSAGPVQVPTLPLGAERSIDAATMQALQQVKHSGRARPQSAGPRAVLTTHSSVVTKSLF